MAKNISISFGGIIIISNLFNKLKRNTASRLISLFKMPIKKIINFVSLFYSMIVLRNSRFLEIYKFGSHNARHNLSLLKIKHRWHQSIFNQDQIK